MIQFYKQETIFPKIKRRIIKTWIKGIIEENGKQPGDISIIFCNDEYLISLNRKFLNKNFYTDILTFNTNNDQFINGDLYISTNSVLRNSNLYNVSYLNEIHRVIIHGILHLIGFDDNTTKEKEEMRKMEDYSLAILQSIGVKDEI